MKQFLERIKTDAKLLLIVALIIGAILLVPMFLLAGIALLSIIFLLFWVVFVFAYFKFFLKYSYVVRALIVGGLIILSLGLLWYAVGIKGGTQRKTTGGTKVNGITLSPCTKTLADKPAIIPGTKSYLYSGPLSDSSIDPESATNITTFSLKGINNKTEKNTFFSHFDMADGSTIQGYDDEMEVCNANNMTNINYNVSSHDQSDIVTESNVTGRTHYFHGGKYIPEPGVYRVDYLVRDKADGKWKLVNRVENITITE